MSLETYLKNVMLGKIVSFNGNLRYIFVYIKQDVIDKK